MNLTEEEIAALRATRTAAEWNAVCNTIKKARGNQYPPDWYEKIIQSGEMTKIERQWGS